MSNKQTSVEWLFEQVWINPVSELPEILEQAKEIHKKEIIEAFFNHYTGTATEYYNETFKGVSE